MSMMMSLMEFAMMLQDYKDPTSGGFMGAVTNGLTIVAIGFVGWSAIKAAQEGDIWASVTRIVIGGVTIALIGSKDFRETLVNLMTELTKQTFSTK